MQKTIVLEFEKNLDEKYKRWTREAVDDFLNLFPQYKDKFKVKEDKPFTKARIEEIIRKSKLDNPNLDERQIWEKFELQPDGTYYLKNVSIDWLLREASENGKVDLQKWYNLKNNNRAVIRFEEPLSVSVCQRPTTFAYGIGGGFGPCLSASTIGDDEGFFKDIVMHELGHTFNATHNDRRNTVENLGSHCTDPDCLMYEYAYTKESYLRRKNGNKPIFCKDCMESMNEYLRETFGKENIQQQEISVDTQTKPEEIIKIPVDPKKKIPFRTFYKKVAEKEGSQYQEDLQAKGFKASLLRSGGERLDVESNCEDFISIKGRDKDGNYKVPSLKDCADTVQLAKERNCIVDISPKSSAEFQARMLIACLEANMETDRKPEITPEFLQQLEQETRVRLLALLNKEKCRKKPAQTASVSRMEQTREDRLKELERKEKLNQLTEAEERQLTVMRASERRKAEKEQAIQDTGNSIDPRAEQHRQRTGLSPEDFYYSSQTRSGSAAWKLHLDVVPNRNDPTTKAVSEMLEALDIEHKVSHGGENGKGMTIYVGNYEDAKRLSKEINLRFGQDIEKSPSWVDQCNEHNFNPKVTGRFYLQGIFEQQYPQSTINGLCPSRFGSLIDRKSEYLVFFAAQKEGLIQKNAQPQEYVGDRKNQDYNTRYEFDILESYCSHKLYQKHMGEFYCGKDADKFEEQIFGAAIPKKGTSERQLWDKTADRYVRAVEHDFTNCSRMDNLVQGYTPVDFSKLPPVSQNGRMQGRGGRP